jgi:glycosyltransferase involved in cell wall biosynthesis
MATGGAESLILEHIRHAGPGVVSHVCALNRGGPAFEAVRALGAPCRVLDKGGDHLGGLRRLAALMREWGIDVVNGHNPTGALYGTLAGRQAGVDVVVRTEHSIQYPGRHSGFYQALLEPLITAQSDAVICICEASRASHARRLRWADRRFVTVLNGISPGPPSAGRGRARHELRLPEEAKVVLTVGSLTWQKAQHDLVDAFAEVSRPAPAAVLLIAGDGRLREPLVARAAERGVAGRVRFLGNRGDVPDLMEAADVFVLSSVREGLSVTLLEAMRAGRPAVVTDVGGNPEVVVDGETGRVVPVGDPAALARAISGLLADPAIARRMGEAGRERWRSRFTAERMVRETEALYRRFLRGARTREEPPAVVLAAGGGSLGRGEPSR